LLVFKYGKKQNKTKTVFLLTFLNVILTCI
jgi:hypothetical protein